MRKAFLQKGQSTLKSNLNVRLAMAHMTKRELERRTGFGKVKVWRMSKDDGIKRANPETLEQVAQVLGCKIGDLYKEETNV